MSMRPIELQFALHKNDEVGLLQNQLNHKPHQDQAHLAEVSLKQAEKDRQVASKAEDVLHASIRDQEKDQPGRRDKKQSRGNRGTAESDDTKTTVARHDHPFKGKHIDLSL